jgi:hypothetical protein
LYALWQQATMQRPHQYPRLCRSPRRSRAVPTASLRAGSLRCSLWCLAPLRCVPEGDRRGRGRQWIRGGISVPDFGLASCFRRLSFPPVLTGMSNTVQPRITRGCTAARHQRGADGDACTCTLLTSPTHLSPSHPTPPSPAPPETRTLTLADPNNLDSNAP